MDTNLNNLKVILDKYPKIFYILLLVDEFKYKHEIYRHTKMAGSSIFKYINILLKLDLIEQKRDGRINYLTYTQNGLAIFNELLKINDIINKIGGKQNGKAR